MSKTMSSDRVVLLGLMLQQDYIIGNFNFSEKKNKVLHASTVSVQDNGKIIFYYGSGPKWFQRLLNSYESVDLLGVGIKIAAAITGGGKTRNKIAFDGITKEILDKAIDQEDYDCIVDVLWDSLRHGADNPLASKYLSNETLNRYAGRAKPESTIAKRMAYVGAQQEDGRIIPIQVGVLVKED